MAAAPERTTAAANATALDVVMKRIEISLLLFQCELIVICTRCGREYARVVDLDHGAAPSGTKNSGSGVAAFEKADDAGEKRAWLLGMNTVPGVRDDGELGLGKQREDRVVVLSCDVV